MWNKNLEDGHNGEEDPNIVFLSSSLNNLLVCGILKGINSALMRCGVQNEELFRPTDVMVYSYEALEVLDPKIFEEIKLSQLKKSEDCRVLPTDGVSIVDNFLANMEDRNQSKSSLFFRLGSYTGRQSVKSKKYEHTSSLNFELDSSNHLNPQKKNTLNSSTSSEIVRTSIPPIEQFVQRVDIKMKIIEFAPYLMGKLRQMMGIEDEEIIMSLDPLNNRE